MAVDCDVVIIGAGIAGLCAARSLVEANRRVLILEKSRGVGGRMATRRIAGAVCDHGAQYFTVRGRAFGGIVSAAADAGIVRTWCDRLPTAAEAGATAVQLPSDPPHARWRGGSGMTDLAKWLVAAAGDRCRVETGRRATAVSIGGDGVQIRLDDVEPGDGRLVTAAAAVVTAPVPQALELFAAGRLTAMIEPEVRAELESVVYDPCFALMLVLRGPSGVPAPGAIQFAGGPIAWIADSLQKGISPVSAVTIHARGDWSREHFEEAPEDVMATLAAAAEPWLGGRLENVVAERSLHRWKFALPTHSIRSPLLAVSGEPPIVCCGDAFGGGRVEAAASSGLAAGRWVSRLLAG